MNRGPNEKRFLTMMGVPEWCGESESREALYGFLAVLLGSMAGDAGPDSQEAPVSDPEPLAEPSPAGRVEVQEKAVSGREKGKPGRKRKMKKK